MTNQKNSIRFTAEVVKVQTMRNDNTIRVTMDLQEGHVGIGADLMDCMTRGGQMNIVATELKLHEFTQNDQVEA